MITVGTLYFGPYHEEIDTYRHEGYAARVMPDGEETSVFGGGYGWTGHVGYRARCECGWSGAVVHPVPDPDPSDCEQAIEEWDRDHITPLVDHARQTTWTGWQQRMTACAEAVVAHMAAGRHRSAIDVLNEIGADLTARLRTVEDLTGPASVEGGGW